MDCKAIEKKFPFYMPIENLPPEAKEQELQVYRVCMWGTIDREAFYSHYELSLHKDYCPIDFDPNNIKYHSASVFTKYKSAKDFLKYVTKKHNSLPRPIIAKGITCGRCGINAGPEDKKGHVNWWVYLDANPEHSFEEYVEDE